MEEYFSYILDKQKNNIQKNIEKAVGFMGLAVNIAKAKSIDEISNAIKDFALPEGAYLLKRNQANPFYVTLNAYLGPAIGSEFELYKYYQYENAETEDQNVNFLKLSPCFTPIGIEVGWNLRNPVLTNIGFFLSIIDVGNIISWRLMNQTTDYLPGVGFSQIVSPGLFGVLGFSKIPITVIGGVFYNPVYMDLINNTTKWHILSVVGSISMDITIYKIY